MTENSKKILQRKRNKHTEKQTEKEKQREEKRKSKKIGKLWALQLLLATGSRKHYWRAALAYWRAALAYYYTIRLHYFPFHPRENLHEWICGGLF